MTSEMGWENWYLRFIIIIPLVVADLCPEPVIPNGEVRGQKEENMFFGEISCDIGYHLVGASKTIKCRHGVWSQKELPVCSAIGTCQTLPKLENGRNVPIQGSRGSAYRFKCNRGYKRFGERRTHCSGNKWSHINMPTCAKATCEWIPLEIPYGEGKAMLGGAVHKYRCNLGAEMEGSGTVVCDGEKWNGTVPHCNVAPTEPELEMIVSGSVVTTVKPGDWVLVTCQATEGHPVPDLGITVGGVSAGSKDFRNLRNSFTFTATEEDDGKNIVCTALNKVGTASSSTELQVYTPPVTAAISGPDTVHHNDEFTYECSVEGGTPAPVITWVVRDHLGQVKNMEGEMVGRGLSRLVIRTGVEERAMSITCKGENMQGVVSHTMYVHTHYLPEMIEITGPTSVSSGEYGHLSCVTSEAFPAPALRFRVREGEEDIYLVGDIKSDTLDDGGLVTSSGIDLLVGEENEQLSALCIAEVEGLGEKNSIVHIIEHLIKKKDMVIAETDTQDTPEEYKTDYQAANSNEDKNEGEEKKMSSKYSAFIETNPKHLKNDQQEKFAETNDYSSKNDQQKKAADTDDSFSENAALTQNDSDVPKENESKDIIKKSNDNEGNKVLWIPYKPVEDIQDYQSVFQPESERSDDTYEEFLRPSDIPEAPMLKQEKLAKAAFVNNPMSVPTDFSSSARISIHSILFIISACLSLLPC